MLVVSNPAIRRLEDGLHHVQWNGERSGFGAPTIAKAEVYLAKLQRGLVHFEPIRTRAHKGEFKPASSTEPHPATASKPTESIT